MQRAKQPAVPAAVGIRALEERLGVPNVMFKSAAFNWIGRVAAGVNMTFVMSTVPVKLDTGVSPPPTSMRRTSIR